MSKIQELLEAAQEVATENQGFAIKIFEQDRELNAVRTQLSEITASHAAQDLEIGALKAANEKLTLEVAALKAGNNNVPEAWLSYWNASKARIDAIEEEWKAELEELRLRKAAQL